MFYFFNMTNILELSKIESMTLKTEGVIKTEKLMERDQIWSLKGFWAYD